MEHMEQGSKGGKTMGKRLAVMPPDYLEMGE
jgi:hypothetical protein